MATINLTQLTKNGQVRNLAGHDRGRAARHLFELGALDQGTERVTVIVPEKVYLLSPSFIQGMFSESIRHFGSREAFLERYGFEASASVLRQIDDGIDASLMRRGSLLTQVA